MPQLQPPSGRAELITLGLLALRHGDFSRAKPLLLLCYLCLEGFKERRHLAELFWPDAADPLASLATELSRLKKHLGEVVDADAGHARARLQTDAQAFLGALERRDLKEAVGLYKGSFLGGVRLKNASTELEEWVHNTRAFLAGRAAGALLSLGEEAARRGDFAEAAGRAEEARATPHAALEPEQVGRAYTLLLAGGHAGAARLRDEMRGAGLLVDGDFDGDLDGDAARTRLRPERRQGADLPSYPTRFVGRGAEVRRAADLLRGEARLVTVAGLAGMGKSRLAVEVVRELQAEFPDGAHLVWLVTLARPDEAPAALANALGLELKGGDILEQVARELADTQRLLLFDNFEHVVAGAPFLSHLLARCPGLKILVTSRERLNLAEEWVMWLGGLGFMGEPQEPTEAAELFRARASRADVNFSASEETLTAIGDICKLVEGSPLAIELAASWVRVMPCAEIRAQLREGLGVLSTRLKNVPERHRSLEAAFEYSWRLLSQEERRVLRELSVFRGGFGREAAREVVGAGLSTLVSLADKSLLVSREGGRFGRHPLLYAFTKRKLLREPERARAKRQDHAVYFATYLEAHRASVQGEQAEAVLEKLADDLSNIYLAWDYFLAEGEAGDLAGGVRTLARFFESSGRGKEGLDFFADAVERANRRTDDPHLLGELYAALTRGLKFQGRNTAAYDAAQKALAHYRRHGDPELIVRSLSDLARLTADSAGEYERAAELLQEAYELTKSRGSQGDEARLLYNLGLTQYYAGSYTAAEASLGRATSLFETSSNKVSYAACLHLQGEIFAVTHELGEAERNFTKGLDLAQALNLRQLEAHFCYALAKLKREQGDVAEARKFIALSLEHTQDMEYQEMMSPILVEYARVAVACHDPGGALDHLNQALSAAREGGGRAGISEVLVGFADWFLATEQYVHAYRTAAYAERQAATHAADRDLARAVVRKIPPADRTGALASDDTNFADVVGELLKVDAPPGFS